METFGTIILALAIIAFFVYRYRRTWKRHERKAQEVVAQSAIQPQASGAVRPYIDAALCIGCSGCANVCPEGDVIAMMAGRAFVVSEQKCIGHERCVDACPVGAITLVKARPVTDANTPRLTPEYETTLTNLFIIGELGGLPLIKNAVNQGRQCVDTITNRIKTIPPPAPNAYDVVIVGAGPAGISASLRAIENKLRYLTIEKDEVGGTVAKFPRQKVITTPPLEFPLFGKLNKTELSKEHLLAVWDMVLNRADFNVCTDSIVEDIRKSEDGIFTLTTPTQQHRARYVVLATGRAGNPKKLGVSGEHLPKVMYRLIDAHQYAGKRILVVGGGDSAVEAAIALAQQPGNQVTVSYRKKIFTRIKERNAKRLREYVGAGRLKVLFDSRPVKFERDSVIIDVGGTLHRLPNHFVWIFAGGTPPVDFLRKIGVGFVTQHSVDSQSL